MIKRFRHKGLQTLYETDSTRGVDAQLAPRLRRMLAALDAGPLPTALNEPAYRLHQLKGDRKGSWSARVSGNWRLVFDIEGDGAVNVDLVDYH